MLTHRSKQSCHLCTWVLILHCTPLNFSAYILTLFYVPPATYISCTTTVYLVHCQLLCEGSSLVYMLQLLMLMDGIIGEERVPLSSIYDGTYNTWAPIVQQTLVLLPQKQHLRHPTYVQCMCRKHGYSV